jgi:c-di-GMP-binding flagellar brake protein YcgR
MSGLLNLLQNLVVGDSMSESYAEVIDILTSLRDKQSEVGVRFEVDGNYYPGVITGVSARHHIMTIRNSVPAAPPALLRDRPVTLRANKQGRILIFNCKFIEPLVADFSLGYQVTIPEEIGTEKPRQAFRVLLDEIRNRVRITLEGPNHQQIDGTVHDISQVGVGMKTDSELPRFLNQYFLGNQQTVGCSIELEKGKQISCQMEIRNVHDVSTNTHATLIGGRILNLTRQDSNLLATFVGELKREYLRAYAA